MKYVFKFINIIFLSVILQVVYFFILVIGMNALSPYLFYMLTGLGIFCAFFIATGKDNAVYRLAWIIPILLIPSVFGMAYLFYNRRKTGRSIESDILSAQKRAAPYLRSCGTELNFNQNNRLTADYIVNTAGFPPACGDAIFFPNGEQFYTAFLKEIKSAVNYIFIEMFIIERGVMWDEILSILIEKVRQGIDVRIIYDATGSAYTLPYSYFRELRKHGIKCVVFNPYRFLFSVRINTSSHRKIISIDGKTAFSGGLNFADEYINKKPATTTGYWKDSAIEVKGDAAWNMTLMFLAAWEFVSRSRVDYRVFMPDETVPCSDSEMPNLSVSSAWCDIPLDNAPVSQRLYMAIIMRASRYVYITTPYLIPPDEILSALCLQAQSGVDVRIILPFIGDKFIVHEVTKTFYSELLESGVKIYEYAPGFIHAKNLVSDDNIASVGSLNLDFRSLYMNYECGVCFHNGKIIDDIRDDFLSSLVSCKEIVLSDYRRTGILRRGFRRICRIFIPFM